MISSIRLGFIKIASKKKQILYNIHDRFYFQMHTVVS